MAPPLRPSRRRTRRRVRSGRPSTVVGATLWIIRPDGTGARQVSAEGRTAFGGAWAPDGLRVAYLEAIGGLAGGHSCPGHRHAGSGRRSCVVAAGPGERLGRAWSPDGQELAFTSNRSGNEEIWAVRFDPVAGEATPQPRQLTNDGAGDWVPAYHPDGSRIAFVSDRTGEPEVWSMATDGTDLRNLSNHPQHFDGNWSLSWSPDGSTLAYGTASFQDPVNSGWVREDFAAAQALLFGLALCGPGRC